MKKLTTLIAILLCTVTLIAQAPEKFTYQAVVRNASNSLVSNTQVGVRVSLLQGSATGNAVYVETQSTTTNTNGLLSMEIGGGTVQQGTFADIDWASGPFFLKTEIDPNGGTNYSITSTQQMLSVPYALYAKESGNGFSGDYNDLTNTPTIPTVPTNVSAFTNDAGYITMDSIPAIPTNVSAFSNDAGYITAQDIPEIPTLDEVYALIQGLQQALDSMSAALDSTQNALNEATAFRCGTSLVSDHEGNTYHTIQLGNQCWTKENMRCTTSPKGAPFSALEKQTWVDEVTGEEHVMYGNWNNQAIYFNNTEINADLVTRGYLYNAWAALDTMYITGVNEWGDIYGDINFDTSFAGRRGICPKGWHLPTHSEWGELRTYVQTTYANNYFCGTASALATNEGWESQVGGAEITDCAPGSNGNGNNITRFSAYPAGFFAGWMDYDQQQYLYDTEVGYCAAFWGSGIVEVPYYPYTYPLATCWIYNWGSDIDVGSGGSSEYHSVRCLKD